MENSEIADVIERAVDILESERKDWCQGDYYQKVPEPDGTQSVVSVCALGAVRLAIVEEQEDRLWRFGHPSFNSEKTVEALVFDALRLHLNSVTGEDWDGIHDYNDERGRTKGQVIDIMKGTVKDLRNANHTVL